MARLTRLVVPGLPHHVTQRGNRREKTFFEDGDYALGHMMRQTGDNEAGKTDHVASPCVGSAELDSPHPLTYTPAHPSIWDMGRSSSAG